MTPNLVAVASEGVEVNFQEGKFPYGMVDGYKVVTWSLHGSTYALVSQEGNATQQSCMICHSAMRDRDLSHMPTPLGAESNSLEPACNRLCQHRQHRDTQCRQEALPVVRFFLGTTIREKQIPVRNLVMSSEADWAPCNFEITQRTGVQINELER